MSSYHFDINQGGRNSSYEIKVDGEKYNIKEEGEKKLNPNFVNEILSTYNNQSDSAANFFSPKEQVVLNDIAKISFDQGEIIAEVNEDSHPKLQKVIVRFDGLCELICNQILQEDLLGKEGVVDDFILKDKITIDTLNENNVADSHILNIHSVVRLVLAFLFRIYPDNTFSLSEQKKLITKKQKEKQKEKELNLNLFSKGIEKIDEGETLKIEVFQKKGFSFNGHSLLIKKTEKGFIFFDPNSGEKRNLRIEDLKSEIDKQIKKFDATDLLFIRGKDYLKRLQDQKIIQVSKKSLA